MDEIKYLDDPRGGRVPLTDAYGNLTIDAMVLYNQGLLSAEGKTLIDEILAHDEMARDALEGYAMMENAKDAKVAVASINNSLGTEKEAAVTPVIKIDYKRFAAAAAILLLVGVGGIFGVKYISQNQLAENIVEKSPEPSTEGLPSKKTIADQVVDESIDRDDLKDGEVASEKNQNQPTSDLSQFDLTEKPGEESQSSTSKKNNSKIDKTNLDRTENKEEEAKNRDELLGKLANLKEQKSELTDSYRNQNETKSLEAEAANSTLLEDELAAVPAQQQAALQQGVDSREVHEPQAEYEREESSRTANESAFSKRSLKAKRASESANVEAADLDLIEENSEKVPDAGKVYGTEEVDQLPRFPGGDLAMFKFIEKRKIHPTNLKAQGIEGEVFVSFQLDGDGNVTNVKPLRADNSQMEADAIRVIRSMPQWQAAKKGGYPVKVKKTILIKYSIKE